MDTRPPERQTLVDSIVNASSSAPVPRVDFTKVPDYSVSLWIRVTTPATYWRNVFFFGVSDDWSNWERRAQNNPGVDRAPAMWIYPDNSTRLHFRHRTIGTGFNDGLDVTNAADLPKMGKWFHYAVTVSGGRSIKVFVNGRQVVWETKSTLFEWNDVGKQKKMSLLGGLNAASGIQIQRFNWFNAALDSSEVMALAKMPIANHIGVPVPVQGLPTSLDQLLSNVPGDRPGIYQMMIDNRSYNVYVQFLEREVMGACVELPERGKPEPSIAGANGT